MFIQTIGIVFILRFCMETGGWEFMKKKIIAEAFAYLAVRSTIM